MGGRVLVIVQTQNADWITFKGKQWETENVAADLGKLLKNIDQRNELRSRVPTEITWKFSFSSTSSFYSEKILCFYI